LSEEIYEIRIDKFVELNSKIATLREAIKNAPCLLAHPGELTYECRHDKKCAVCNWRHLVAEEFQAEFNETF
jgi:hypothetical protein